jgi:hypothetical protein
MHGTMAEVQSSDEQGFDIPLIELTELYVYIRTTFSKTSTSSKKIFLFAISIRNKYKMN